MPIPQTRSEQYQEVRRTGGSEKEYGGRRKFEAILLKRNSWAGEANNDLRVESKPRIQQGRQSNGCLSCHQVTKMASKGLDTLRGRVKKQRMDESIYDEFGNYNGPEIESDLESDEKEVEEDMVDMLAEEDKAAFNDEDATANFDGWITASSMYVSRDIILAEEKKYCSVYGKYVETLILNEEEQPIEQLVIKAVKNIKFELGVKDSSSYVSTQFLVDLMSNPSLVRNVALVGQFQRQNSFCGHVGGTNSSYSNI